MQKQSALEQRVYLEKKQSKRTPPEKGEKEKSAFNTHSRGIHRISMQEMLMQMLDILRTGAEFSNQNLAARRFPMTFICGWANSVIDGETDNLLEHRHLIKRP